MLRKDLIDQLPEEGARLVALSLLEEAWAASRRLVDPVDAEALHDFRVALRRLRSTTSAYRKQLVESIPRKRRRQLRELAAATGAARDAEVQIAWLGSRRERLPRQARPALDWLLGSLEARREAAYRDVRQPVRQRFQRLAPKLLDALSVYGAKPGKAPRGTFAGTVAELLRSHVASLHDALAEVASAGDAKAAHRARIEGKRLRYLLEPLRGNAHADSAKAVKRLKRLQDLLGELNDCHGLAELLSGLVGEAGSKGAKRARAVVPESNPREGRVWAAPRQDLRNGLIAIDRLAERERDLLFSELERHWLGGRDEPLVGAVEDLAAALTARDRRAVPSPGRPAGVPRRPVPPAFPFPPGPRPR